MGERCLEIRIDRENQARIWGGWFGQPLPRRLPGGAAVWVRGSEDERAHACHTVKNIRDAANRGDVVVEVHPVGTVNDHPAVAAWIPADGDSGGKIVVVI